MQLSQTLSREERRDSPHSNLLEKRSQARDEGPPERGTLSLVSFLARAHVRRCVGAAGSLGTLLALWGKKRASTVSVSCLLSLTERPWTRGGGRVGSGGPISSRLFFSSLPDLGPSRPAVTARKEQDCQVWVAGGPETLGPSVQIPGACVRILSICEPRAGVGSVNAGHLRGPATSLR